MHHLKLTNFATFIKVIVSAGKPENPKTVVAEKTEKKCEKTEKRCEKTEKKCEKSEKKCEKSSSTKPSSK